MSVVFSSVLTVEKSQHAAQVYVHDYPFVVWNFSPLHLCFYCSQMK